MATLNELITEAGLRKKELSDQSGVDVATIIRIGNGKAVLVAGLAGKPVDQPSGRP